MSIGQRGAAYRTSVTPSMRERVSELEEIARDIRELIVEAIANRGSGHWGSSLSCVDILTALYFDAMNVNPDDPSWRGRDRFVMSKGHAAPAIYATLCRRGYFPREVMMTLRRVGSPLQGHPDMHKTPGIDVTTGSLGQGLSLATGIALGLRMDGIPAYTYALLGDGELNEGQVWEAAAAAAHFNLTRLIAFVDVNGLQIHGFTKDVMNLGDLALRWQSARWRTIEIDGHDMAEILRAIEWAQQSTAGPSVILARTVKGKGVPGLEGTIESHGKSLTPEQVKDVLDAIRASRKQGARDGMEAQ